MTRTLVSVGDLVLDVILPVKLPVVGGQHQEVQNRRVEPGGAANMMIAARRMGLHVLAAGGIGGDVFGTAIRDLLALEGIDISCVTVLPEATSTLVIALADPESGEHVFIGHYGEGPEMPYPDKLDETISTAGALFVMGYSLAEARARPMTLRAIERARAVSVPMYLDVGPFFSKVPADQIPWLLERCALLMMTEDEVPSISGGLSGEAAYSHLLASGPSMLVVKLGARGCEVITADSRLHAPGFSVPVVDTIGAGDCFAGAFVAGRLRGLNMADCARLANAMGAAAVQKMGAGRNAPTYGEVLAVLDRAGETLTMQD